VSRDPSDPLDPPSPRSRLCSDPGRVARRTALALLTVGVSSSLATTPAAAHGASAGTGFDAATVLGVAVVSGLFVGLFGVVSGHHQWPELSSSGRRYATDAGFVVLGLGLALPAFASTPAFAAAGVVAGGATAVLFACRRTRYGLCSSCGRHADVAAGALAAHRAVEGLALGAAAAVGGAVGVVGAALVAGHAAVEAGLLGHAYGRTSVGWGVVVVAGLQSALAIGGAVGAVTPLHVPPAVETAALAAVGAVLFTTGLDGVRAWLPATGA
jgi:hypothetical protein